MDVAGGAPSRCGVPIRRPGKGREQDAVSFAYMDVGKGREQDAVSFAYMDVGKGREQDAVSFTHRLSEHFYIADFKPLGNQELA